MFKRLYLWLMLGASTAALIGCGGGNGIDAPAFDPPSCEGADASSDACLPPPPPPDPCDATPQPAECVTDKISITSPAANSLWAKPEMNLVVTFNAGTTPAGLQLKLNGKDVMSFAAIDNAQAAIAGADIEALLVNGDNTFEAIVGTEAEKVTFSYDLEAPHIIVTSAVEATTNAVQQNPGDTLKVSGLVRDVAPIAAVTINDVPATIAGNEFTVVIAHSDIYRVSATDSNGQSSELSFAAPQHRLEPMLAMQINDSIFKVVQPIINDIFSGLDTSSLGGSSERFPLSDNTEVAISRLDLNKGGAPSIDMHFVPSATESLAIEIDVDLPLVGMGLLAYKTAATAPSMDIDLDVADVGLKIVATVSSDELNRMRLGLGSVEPFDLAMSGLTINRFDCTGIDAICNAIATAVNSAFSDPVRVQALMDMVTGLVTPMLADMLADIEISSQPAHMPMDTNGDGIDDTELTMEIAPSLLTTGTQGNAYVEMAGSLYVANDKLPAGYKGALGSVYVDASAVPAFAGTTDAGKEYDLAIALPSNFLNQAFFALYQSGAMSAFNMELDGSALGAMGAFLGNPEKIQIRMEMSAVPYMQLSNENLSDGRTAGITMHLDNVTMRIYSRKAGETDFTVQIGMVADIAANLELGIDENNYINLGVDNLVDMNVVSVLKEGFNASGALSPALIESQIAPAVTGMLKTDTLPDMLKKTMEIAISMADESNVPMQLPLNMGMIMRDLSVDDSDAYLVLKIDLLDADEVANATENVPFRINISKRPPVTPEEAPAP